MTATETQAKKPSGRMDHSPAMQDLVERVDAATQAAYRELFAGAVFRVYDDEDRVLCEIPLPDDWTTDTALEGKATRSGDPVRVAVENPDGEWILRAPFTNLFADDYGIARGNEIGVRLFASRNDT